MGGKCSLFVKWTIPIRCEIIVYIYTHIGYIYATYMPRSINLFFSSKYDEWLIIDFTSTLSNKPWTNKGHKVYTPTTCCYRKRTEPQSEPPLFHRRIPAQTRFSSTKRRLTNKLTSKSLWIHVVRLYGMWSRWFTVWRVDEILYRKMTWGA